MPNAIFIDTSNLNALFKVSGKFVLGTNYASCPDKIATDAQALGVSFDVYLSMWPRQAGESEDIVNALSVGGVPFVVIPEEVEAAFKLVDKIPGAGNIYLCNALANFVIQARVSNFQSAINYGTRVALVTVKNKLLEELRIYETSEDLYQDKGDGFSCYGDLDLIDVDAVKAQYEELTPFNKSVLVPLAHLVTSYHSPYNVEMDVVKKELGLGEYAGQKPVRVQEEETPPPPPKPAPKREPIKPQYTDDDVEERVQFKKPGVSLLNVLLILVILAGCAVSGLGYSFQKMDAQVSQLRQNIAPFQAEAQQYDILTRIYTTCLGAAGEAADVLNYAQVNPCGFSVSGIEVRSDSIVIRCNTTDPEAITDFENYLGQQYTLGEVNNLDNTSGSGDTTIYNYNITIARL